MTSASRELVDLAGNTLDLTPVMTATRSDSVTAIQTLSYNGGPVVWAKMNALSFSWKLKKNGSFDELRQSFFVLSPFQTATAEWRARDNRTRITSFIGGRTSRTTVPGMFLLRMATNGGALSIETTP